MTVGTARVVVQIVSADKPVTTVLTITNVAQAKSVAMAIVCHRALLTFQSIQLFGAEVLLPPL